MKILLTIPDERVELAASMLKQDTELTKMIETAKENITDEPIPLCLYEDTDKSIASDIAMTEVAIAMFALTKVASEARNTKEA